VSRALRGRNNVTVEQVVQSTLQACAWRINGPRRRGVGCGGGRRWRCSASNVAAGKPTARHRRPANRRCCSRQQLYRYGIRRVPRLCCSLKERGQSRGEAAAVGGAARYGTRENGRQRHVAKSPSRTTGAVSAVWGCWGGGGVVGGGGVCVCVCAWGCVWWGGGV